MRSGETLILKADDPNPEGSLQGYVNDEITIFVKVIGLVNIEDEIARIAKRVTQLEDFKAKMVKKMSIPNYEEKVPEKVRTENDEKMKTYEVELEELAK